MVIKKQVKMVTGINLFIVVELAKNKVNQGRIKKINKIIFAVIKLNPPILFHHHSFLLFQSNTKLFKPTLSFQSVY
ncbi:hypothetical protein CKF96_04215 (plasmid) [Priestia filamentosa]|nr:hypothetical protein CKF96_04215 [Priestia filamentosa]